MASCGVKASCVIVWWWEVRRRGNDVLGGYQDMVNRINGLAGHDQLLGGGPMNDALAGGDGNDRSLWR